jgi:hypothetical protein
LVSRCFRCFATLNLASVCFVLRISADLRRRGGLGLLGWGAGGVPPPRVTRAFSGTTAYRRPWIKSDLSCGSGSLTGSPMQDQQRRREAPRPAEGGVVCVAILSMLRDVEYCLVFLCVTNFRGSPPQGRTRSAWRGAGGVPPPRVRAFSGTTAYRRP